jgi:hypothetical protein
MRRVLVVDDEENLRLVLSTLFKCIGAQALFPHEPALSSHRDGL